ncbi:mucin-2-like [Syngnathoides biaculeatus]|uniref:mucin-2-like n=1 Tax=Syngnathoides biaculeatus TaxID=300417 RepID=UPI002ADE38A1|nr:mucin-2-like [Syngnathoides biaculeatus]
MTPVETTVGGTTAQSETTPTQGQTSTRVPATQEPTTTQMPETQGPTTTHIFASQEPTSTHVVTTHGPTSSHVPSTQAPTTTHNSTPTREPTSTHVTTTHEPTPTQGQTSTRVPATQGPTTTQMPETHQPTTTHVLSSQGATPSHVATTHGPTSSRVPATQGPAAPNPTTPVAVSTSPPPVVVLSATLEEPFVEAFNNVSSVQYLALETRVVTSCDAIYRQRFGFIFIRTFIIRIFQAVVVTRMGNTQIELGLEFSNTSSTPTDEDVVTTLEDALAQPNNTFNVSLVANTLQVIRSPPRTDSTTAKADTTVAQVTTATRNPASSSTPLTTRTLRFTSVGETFTSDLLNQSSPAFIVRALIIRLTLEPLYTATFSSFKDLTVTSFRNGSIINLLDLRFITGSVPSSNAIASVLINAAANITTFNVDTSSIFVDGTLVSSSASQKTSLIATSGMVLLSWLAVVAHLGLFVN